MYNNKMGDETENTVVEVSASEGAKPVENKTENVPEDTGQPQDDVWEKLRQKNPTLKFTDVDQMLKEAFTYPESNNSMICDIIAMYLKGQKILYTEAKTLCEQRLHYLMLPTICITAVCAVISVVLKEYEFSSTIVSSLNGLNFFFLTLINYLKLDAKAEAHRVAAYKFDKIQSRLEFSSGKILFLRGESKDLPKILAETEKDVREIKETNQFILPESIRYSFPRLVNMNIFAEVKKIQSQETKLINDLKEIMNEHIQLTIKLSSQTNIADEDSTKKKELEENKKRLTDRIIMIRDKYIEIDDMFEQELDIHRLKPSKRYQLCGCLKT